MEPKIRKPVSNLRKLKHIEKAVQRDWGNREKIRADGLRELGFYSDAKLSRWIDNPVRVLYGILMLANSKRRAAIFRVARAALKQNALVKIQSLQHPFWEGKSYGLPSLMGRDELMFPAKFLKRLDLRSIKFSTPEQDKYESDLEEIQTVY